MFNFMTPAFRKGAIKGFVYGSIIGSMILTVASIHMGYTLGVIIGAATFILAVACAATL